MGIKNLNSLLQRQCGFAINTRKLDSYRGMKLGIDLSIFLYKYLYNNDDHIEGLTRLILRLLKNQITPIFIFDGKPPKEKDETLMERKVKKELMTIKKTILEQVSTLEKPDYETFKKNVIETVTTTSALMNNTTFELNESELRDLYDKSTEEIQKDTDKLNKKIIYVTAGHIDSAKQLFNLFGIKYIHEQCEAESLLAYMCKMGYIDGCISEDTDILPNGGHLFLRNFNADKNTVDEYCLQGVLDGLGLNHDQFIDLCILCGCDYTTKIHGLGPINAHKLLKEHGSIEEIIRLNTKFEIPDNFEYEKARYLFKNPVPDSIFNNVNKDIFIYEPKIIELLDFLKTSKLKDKFLREIRDNLMNYFLNIKGGIYDFDLDESSSLDSKKPRLKKITDFWK